MNWKKLITFSQCINHIKVKKTVKLHTEEKGFDDSNRFLSFKRQVDILKKRIFFPLLLKGKSHASILKLKKIRNNDPHSF